VKNESLKALKKIYKYGHTVPRRRLRSCLLRTMDTFQTSVD